MICSSAEWLIRLFEIKQQCNISYYVVIRSSIENQIPFVRRVLASRSNSMARIIIYGVCEHLKLSWQLFRWRIVWGTPKCWEQPAAVDLCRSLIGATDWHAPMKMCPSCGTRLGWKPNCESIFGQEYSAMIDQTFAPPSEARQTAAARGWLRQYGLTWANPSPTWCTLND